MMKIQIQPGDVFKKLTLAITVLLFMNTLGLISKFQFDHDNVYGLITLFDFNQEKNIPTLFSSFLLIITSAVLASITSTQKKLQSPYIAWGGLSLIFMFLSIDEFVSLHEMLVTPVRTLLNTSGALRYAWVIPYGAMLIVFVISYLKFLYALPRKIGTLFILSGGVYVTGALGFELIGSWYHDNYGTDNLMYSMIYTTEELLEMLGITLFITTLLLHIGLTYKDAVITINTPE